MLYCTSTGEGADKSHSCLDKKIVCYYKLTVTKYKAACQQVFCLCAAMYLTMDANFQQKNYVILFTLLQNIPLTMKQFD